MNYIIILRFALMLIMFGCGGSNEVDNLPKPIGGDEKVRLVFQRVLGDAYTDVEGSEVTFSIRLNESGVIEEVAMSQRTNSERANRIVVFALKDNIRFTPTIKDGKKVKVSFKYDFTF